MDPLDDKQDHTTSCSTAASSKFNILTVTQADGSSGSKSSHMQNKPIVDKRKRALEGMAKEVLNQPVELKTSHSLRNCCNRNSSRFCVPPEDHCDDPIKAPVSCPLGAHIKPFSSSILRGEPSFSIPLVKKPSTFALLSRYGYEVKYSASLLKLNISGTTFLVRISTLQRDQMVFDKILEDAEYIPETDEYYLERDPVVFRFVHAYLRHQELHLPLNICGPLLEKELENWGLQLGFDLQRCCLGPVIDTKSKMESLRRFEDNFSESAADYHSDSCFGARWNRLQQYVWRIITDIPKKRWLGSFVNDTNPETKEVDTLIEGSKESLSDQNRGDAIAGNHQKKLQSENIDTTDSIIKIESEDPDEYFERKDSQNSGKFSTNRPFDWRTLQKTPREIILSRTYVAAQFLIVASLIIYMIMAYSSDLREPFGPIMKAFGINNTDRYSFPVHRSFYIYANDTLQATRPFLPIRILTWVCVASFTIDLIARAIFCPKITHWLRSFYTITDIVSLTPFYAEGILWTYINVVDYSPSMEARIDDFFLVIDILNLFKVLVVCRIFRLLQRQRSTRVLVYTIRTAATNIAMVFELIFLCAIFFGTSIFFFDSNINSIFTGIWWAFTTMTTVGYGDVTPSTTLGRLIAVFCMIIGVLLTSYTIPVLVNDFLLFYGHADQLAWMRRVHKTATAKRRTDRRNLMAKRRITQVRALIKNAVIGVGTLTENGNLYKGRVSNEGRLATPLPSQHTITSGSKLR